MQRQDIRRRPRLLRGTFAKRRPMIFRLPVSLGFALLVAGGSSASACRDAKTGKVMSIEDTSFVKAQSERYVYQSDGSGNFYKLKLGTSSRPKELHFCVDLELPTPPGADAEVGLYFWRNESNIYVFETKESRFTVDHAVFRDDHPLVFWSPIPFFGKDAPRMREVEFEAHDGGAKIKVDGRLLTDFVARPPSGALDFGLLLRAKDKATVLRFARPTVFGQ